MSHGSDIRRLAYSGGTFDICVTYGPTPELFKGFERLIVPFPASFWAAEGRVYGSPLGIGTSADRGASLESKILRAAARRQRRMGTSDGPQHVPKNVPVVNSRRPGSLECASALQGAALSHNSQATRTDEHAPYLRHLMRRMAITQETNPA